MKVRNAIGVVALATSAAIGFAAPSSAVSAASFNCNTTLPAFPALGGSGVCTGSLTGVLAGAQVNGGVLVANFTYNELAGCMQGNASGSVTVNGDFVGNFAWVRVGATAVVQVFGGPESANAVAAFEADPATVAACSGAPLNVTVQGAVAGA